MYSQVLVTGLAYKRCAQSGWFRFGSAVGTLWCIGQFWLAQGRSQTTLEMGTLVLCLLPRNSHFRRDWACLTLWPGQQSSRVGCPPRHLHPLRIPHPSRSLGRHRGPAVTHILAWGMLALSRTSSFESFRISLGVHGRPIVLLGR